MVNSRQKEYRVFSFDVTCNMCFSLTWLLNLLFILTTSHSQDSRAIYNRNKLRFKLDDECLSSNDETAQQALEKLIDTYPCLRISDSTQLQSKTKMHKNPTTKESFYYLQNLNNCINDQNRKNIEKNEIEPKNCLRRHSYLPTLKYKRFKMAVDQKVFVGFQKFFNFHPIARTPRFGTPKVFEFLEIKVASKSLVFR